MNWNGKNKSVTFSYDDDKLYDRRLVELFNQYGLKATFNLNSAYLGFKGKNVVTHEEVKRLYNGHEVAAHTLLHPRLEEEPDHSIVWQVETDRKALSDLAGDDVVGMVYPYGMQKRDDRAISIIKQNTKVEYARTTNSTYGLIYKPRIYCFLIRPFFIVKLIKCLNLQENLFA